MNKFLKFSLILFGALQYVEASNLITIIDTSLGNKINIHQKLTENDSILTHGYLLAKKLVKQKKYVEALKVSLLLLDKTKELNDQRYEFLSLSLIADIHDKNRNYKKSLNFYKKSYQFIHNRNDEFRNLKYYSIEEYAKNLLYLGSAFQKLKVNDSAIYYYKELDKISSLNDQVLSFKASSYSNLSGIFQKDTSYLDSHKKAIDYAKRAIKIHEKRNNKISQTSAINNLANVYLIQGDFEKSKKTYFEAINLINRDTSTKAIRYKADLYYNLAWAMRNLKEYQAYDKLITSVDMENGLRKLETHEMLERITGEYNVNTVRQEEELKRQLVINQKQSAQRNSWFIGVISLSIIIFLAFFLNQYKLRQNNLSLKLSRQELLQQQRIEKVKSDSQIRILNATIDGKETERKQIAETLHDNVSALLSSANLHLQACKKIFNGTVPLEVEKSQSIINEASCKIRDLSHTLVSSILLKFGLGYAIKDLANKYSNSQLLISYETKSIRRYEQGFEIKLYNIIQEFVNNILKHSEATQANIILLEKNHKLYLRIEDNGKGFEKNKILEKDGLGINQIDARIQMMKGKFIIETKKDNGTLINIELPVYEKAKVNFS